MRFEKLFGCRFSEVIQIKKFCLHLQHIRASLGKHKGQSVEGIFAAAVCRRQSWIQPQQGPCWCSPAAPAEPVVPCRSVHLGGHDLAVNCPQQQHKAQGSHHLTGTHNRHHEVQHHCYNWKGGNGTKAKIKVCLNYFFLLCFVVLLLNSCNYWCYTPWNAH